MRFKPNNIDAQSLEALLSATLYLMSKHTREPSSELASVIVDHLSLISRDMSHCMPTLSESATRLMEDWRRMPASATKRQSLAAMVTTLQ